MRLDPQYERFADTVPAKSRKLSSSGTLYIRSNAALVRKIRAAAKRDKKSVNQWCVDLLTKVTRKDADNEHEL